MYEELDPRLDPPYALYGPDAFEQGPRAPRLRGWERLRGTSLRSVRAAKVGTGHFS